jgi:D-psicose/D-tagatose/L-ribulose 3-epimerase
VSAVWAEARAAKATETAIGIVFNYFDLTRDGASNNMSELMKFGANTLIWSGSFGPAQFDLLPRIKEAGFDGVEIPIFDAAAFDAAEARRAIEASGLECTACSALMSGQSLIADDASVRARTMGQMRDLIAAAAEAGATILAGPMYSPVGYLPGRRRTAEEWQRAVEAWQVLGETLAAHGVTLAIEPLNRFETYFLNTAADAVKLCDEIRQANVGILFDTFHANIEEKNIARALQTCGRHLKHVHTCENDRGTPGSGHVEWDEVFGAVREIKYDRWLTIESFGFNIPEICAAAAIWRDIEKTPEQIAFDGVKFLKQRTAAGHNAAPAR